MCHLFHRRPVSTLVGYFETCLDGRTSFNPSDPCTNVGVGLKIDTRSGTNSDPGEGLDVRNTVSVASKVLVLAQLCLQNREETFRLVQVTVDRVRANIGY